MRLNNNFRCAVIAAGFLGLVSAGTTPSFAQGVSVKVGPGGVGVRVGDDYRKGRRHNWGPGFYFHQGRYHGDCRWLRQRARQTGNPIWMRRFNQCRQR